MEPIITPTTHEPPAPHPWPPSDRVRIVSSPGVCGGRPRIDGHRVTVEDVAIWHQRLGMSPDEIASAYPSISLSDVHSALAYYYEHRVQIDGAIEEGEQFAAQIKAQAPRSLVRQKLEQKRSDATDDPVPP